MRNSTTFTVRNTQLELVEERPEHFYLVIHYPLKLNYFTTTFTGKTNIARFIKWLVKNKLN